MSSNKSLRSLYNRAARAFLNRDLLQTHSLIQSAFDLLDPSQFSSSSPELLRKWDILRITFETTVYSSPSISLPESLKSLSLKTPQSFVSDLFSRSIQLFSKPRDDSSSKLKQLPSAAFDNPDSVLLPAPVLVTLVYSSLKVECPESGRRMIEDWLAKRGDYLAESQFSTMNSSLESLPSEAGGGTEGDGYEKVLELYCIQVLPKLEEWEYATEFLEYESELGMDSRENLKSTLRILHTQHMQQTLLSSSSSSSSLPSSLRLPPQSPSPSPSSFTTTRSTSPAPSTSSSSSSLSTTSTHTIVPATPRPAKSSQANGHGYPNGTSKSLSSFSSLSSTSSASPSPSGSASHHRPHSHSRSSSSTSASDGTATPTDRKLPPNGNGFNNPTGPYASSSSSPKSKSRSNSKSNSNAKSRHQQYHHPLNPNGLTPFSLPNAHLYYSQSHSYMNGGSTQENQHHHYSGSMNNHSGSGFSYFQNQNQNQNQTTNTSRSSSPNVLTLLRASVDPYLDRLRTLLGCLLFGFGNDSSSSSSGGSGSSWKRRWGRMVWVMLMVLVPMVSVVVGVRRRMRMRLGMGMGIGGSAGGRIGGVGSGTGAGALVGAGVGTPTIMTTGKSSLPRVELDKIKARLRHANDHSGLGNVVGRVWEEVVNAVMDTVKMGGSGLV
ncbi:hypothetical protein K435DRAFT_959845 [Dendrothele bispora CBS 962.96]|uniref:Uncharacterized protein n=1 Tax=Dendrothele bispora (strain CBS 962.96) TaxID=1314807 RepID=A0A4V4HIN3_DENBC|nr:hypothetical protein K435DRAFT_959845 [Dendrothele bispora CBS 962.96]